MSAGLRGPRGGRGSEGVDVVLVTRLLVTVLLRVCILRVWRLCLLHARCRAIAERMAEVLSVGLDGEPARCSCGTCVHQSVGPGRAT